MFLIVAPFTFIRFFYAPWLEAQIKNRAPRSLEEDLSGHVIICRYDLIAQGLIEHFLSLDIPYVVIEPDPAVAASLHIDGVSVVTGRRDVRETYEAVCVEHARLVIANLSDAENANIALTVREVAPEVPIACFAEFVDSIDVLELAGVNRVLPLKEQLGEQLASRVTAGLQVAHRIGHFEGLVIAEFPVYGTALVGRTIRDTNLRRVTGLSIIGIWERGRLASVGPETILSKDSIPIVMGTEDQIEGLDALFVIYHETDTPVLVIGGGVVGRAVSRSLRDRGAAVTILESDASLRSELEKIADRVVIGDAANLQTVKSAGIEEAPSVVLTTSDDPTNIFLTVYCRGLSSEAHIVSRISGDRNLDAIHRAGANFALSRETLAIQTLVSMVRGHELILFGGGIELFVEPVPSSLVDKTLESSGIGERSGLNVIGVRKGTDFEANPGASKVLEAGAELVMFGTVEQRTRFHELHAKAKANG
jgi:Trk K+ transport system NAD-binding subunit